VAHLGNLGRPALAVAAAALIGVTPGRAQAFSPFLVVPEPSVAEASPAYRYANMTDAQAFAELDRRRILYTKLTKVPGVQAPIRLTGRLQGVEFRSSLPPEERVTSIFEILDARLALSLDDFAVILARHDIDEVVHFTMYRPNLAKPSAEAHVGRVETSTTGPTKRPRASHSHAAKKKGVKTPARAVAPSPMAAPSRDLGAKGRRGDAKSTPAPSVGHTKQKGRATEIVKPSEPLVIAPAAARAASTKPAPPGGSRAQSTKPAVRTTKDATRADSAKPAVLTPSQKTTWAAPGTRHPAGLAIDVGLLHKRDGRWLSVTNDFRGKIGERTCGAGARVPDEPAARELRAIVCEAADAGVFTYVLTPDYNVAHADHFHMEIKAGVKWFLYH
jgi:hypothetical protein